MTDEEKELHTILLRLVRIKGIIQDKKVKERIGSLKEIELIWLHTCIQQIYAGTNDMLKFLERVQHESKDGKI